MAETIRWSLEISKEADDSLRSYLAQHGLPDRDLSRFVEVAVHWRILDRTVAETSAANAGIPAEEIEAAIGEALQAVRAERFRE
jgi:Ribbon-helix-helix domain